MRGVGGCFRRLWKEQEGSACLPPVRVAADNKLTGSCTYMSCVHCWCVSVYEYHCCTAVLVYCAVFLFHAHAAIPARRLSRPRKYEVLVYSMRKQGRGWLARQVIFVALVKSSSISCLAGVQVMARAACVACFCDPWCSNVGACG